MYKSIRVAVASLIVMMICVLSSTLTLSYFTDTVTQSSDFTIGNASTELEVEFQRADTNAPITNGEMIPFSLQATNDGNIPIFQRFRIVIPIDLSNAVSLSLAGNDCKNTGTSASGLCSNENYTITHKESVSIENNARYAEYYIVSQEPLSVGDKTAEWSNLPQFEIGDIPSAGSEPYTCESGNNSCVLGIKFYSDSIQTTGFENAEQAFENFTETYE